MAGSAGLLRRCAITHAQATTAQALILHLSALSSHGTRTIWLHAPMKAVDELVLPISILDTLSLLVATCTPERLRGYQTLQCGNAGLAVHFVKGDGGRRNVFSRPTVDDHGALPGSTVALDKVVPAGVHVR